MARALEILPQAAALFEAGGHRFIAANRRGEHLRAELVDKSERRDEIVQQLYQSLGEAEVVPEGSYSARLPGAGVVHVSRMRAKPYHTRPDLLIATLHQGVDDATAWLDHQRMIMTLNVNEEAEIACRQMETALTQIAASLQSTRELIHNYNTRMGHWLAVSDSEKSAETS